MISSEFIEMSRAAKEIQEQWIPHEGDRYYSLIPERLCGKNVPGLKYMGYIRECPDEPDKHLETKDKIWLPRQEDLQAIAIDYLIKEDRKNGGDPKGWENLFLQDAFWKWYHGFWNRSHEFETMNFSQLWLCFVMEMCYGKRWDNEKKKWVKKYEVV